MACAPGLGRRQQAEPPPVVPAPVSDGKAKGSIMLLFGKENGMKKLAIAALATLGAAPAFAVGACPPGQVCAAVPEISALEGSAAIAALAAIVLLTWERRRRAH